MVAFHGDEKFANSEEGYDHNEPPKDHVDSDASRPPLEFEDFKHLIDTRGGYLQMTEMATGLEDFEQEYLLEYELEKQVFEKRKEIFEGLGMEVPAYILAMEPLIPGLETK